MKTNEKYLTLDFPDWWYFETKTEALDGAYRQIQDSKKIEPVIVYEAKYLVHENGDVTVIH